MTVIRDGVLEPVSDGRLKVYMIWEPILPKDLPDALPEATTILSKEWRARQFWDAQAASGKALLKILNLKIDKPAWDVYLYYEPGVRWDATPPAPAFWMHQLTFKPFSEDARLHGPKQLDAGRFRAELLRRLASGQSRPARRQASHTSP